MLFESSQRSPFWVFFSVLFVVLLSKSLYFESYGENALLILLLCYFLMIVVLKTTLIKINVYLILITTLLILVVMINPDMAISSFLVLIIRALIAVLFVSLIPFQAFVKCYVKIILFLSVVSWFSWLIILFDIQSFLPNFSPTDERIIRNFLFFGVWDSFVVHQNFRNSGLWWEPGAFQVFVNLAFMFLIVTKSLNLKHFVIILITILTISSTTGFVVFFLLSCAYFYKKIKFSLSLINVLYLTVAIAFLFIVIFLFSPNISEKFNSESGSFVSFLSRYYDYLISFNLFIDNPLLGYGFGSQLQIAIPYGELLLGDYEYNLVKPTGADGLTMFVAQTGVFGLLFLFLFVFPKYMYKQGFFAGLMFSMSLILMFNTENLTFTVIFMVLLLYSFKSYFSGKVFYKCQQI